MNTARMLLLWPALAGLATSAMAADGFRLSFGTEFTTGDYGGRETTQIWSFPLSLTYARGPLAFKLIVPYLQVKGRGDVIPGITPVVNDERRSELESEDEHSGGAGGSGAGATSTTRRKTASGLGDVVASASYALIDDGAWRAALTGKVKFPTADQDKNLGSGRTDYSAQFDLDHGFGHLTPFASVGYRWLGDRPDLPLRNIWYASFGMAWKLSDRTSVDMAYDWGQASSADIGRVGEITLGASHRIAQGWKLSAYLLHGVSSGSPDWGGGASVGYAF